ncbi:DUF397 domain-containing protein [Sphaerisporangium sp. NPDC051017]|uniref:DUF397 domain-containing protein n=1 Tax=Sphaerisporangium sp. NPDC051017 TaxID=3154636 RepID=UPI003432501D
MAKLPDGGHALRDSKISDSPVLAATPRGWTAFLDSVKNGLWAKSRSRPPTSPAGGLRVNRTNAEIIRCPGMSSGKSATRSRLPRETICLALRDLSSRVVTPGSAP